MHVMVLFSIHPMDKGPHVGAHVARAVEIIRASGLEHDLGPSGTTILGDWDEVFACVKACHEALAEDCVRVSSLLKVDQGDHPPGAIRAKVARTEARLAGTPARGSRGGTRGRTRATRSKRANGRRRS